MSGTVRIDKVIIDPSPDSEKRLQALRTRLASKFVTLAETVTDAFEDFHIGAGNWVVELTAPEGMSTGGGKRVVQHFRLRPRRQGFPVIVGGSVNPMEKEAELRDYEHACMVHAVRFKGEFGVSYEEWEQFLRQAEVVLETAKIKSTRVGPPKELVAQAKKRISPALLAAFLVVSALAAVMIWRVYVSLAH